MNRRRSPRPSADPRTSRRPALRSCAVLPCPLGALLAVARDGRLIRLSFFDSTDAAEHALDDLRGAVHDPTAPPLREAATQLSEYFAGTRTVFDLPLAPEGTDFQQTVWRALAEIPWGETRGYGDLADAVGRPGAARAVGGAMNRNPIAIVLPCHRVIGSGGDLTGYGAGLDRKRFLLELEEVLPPRLPDG